MNPQLPSLIDDIKLLAKVTDTYADVIPELAATLRNTVKTGNTLVSRQAKLHAFLKDFTAFSDTTKAFLDANGDNIIRLGQLSEPILALLSRYSGTFPCMLEGIVRQAPRLADTFRGLPVPHHAQDHPVAAAGLHGRRQTGLRREQRAQLRAPAQPADPVLPARPASSRT